MRHALSRREFLTVAATAPLALQSLGLVGAAETQTRLPLITLFLSGGASAKETFNPDPPGTPVELRGPLNSITTRTPGIHFSELFPRLASQSDQFSLLRALDSGNVEHDKSQETAALSGTRTIAEVVGDKMAQNVPYVLLNPGSNFAGLRSAFRISSSFGPLWDATQRKFITPAGGAQQDIQEDFFYGYMPVERPPAAPAGPPPGLSERRALLKAIETKPMDSPMAKRMERFRETAFDLLLGGGSFFEALDLPERDRERYGKNLAGDMTLLAKRFVERGAGAVTVFHTPSGNLAWDAHSNIESTYRTIAPEVDQAASALIDEIASHRLECVLLLMGEFNRTPQINSPGKGRDHWRYGNCAIIAGGHTRKGVVHGSTNPQGNITREGVQQREVLGNTVMLATGLELDALKPRVREILT